MDGEGDTDNSDPRPEESPAAPVDNDGTGPAPIPTPVLIGLIVVGLIVVAGIGRALSGGDDRDDLAAPEPIIQTTTSPTDGSVAETGSDDSAPDIERPDIASIDCNLILDSFEASDALGEIAGELAGSFRYAQGETCRDEHFDDDTIYVLLEPGLPTDVRPGARLLDMTGEPVDGVWDAAVWFAGEGEGLLAVQQSTDLGLLSFRVGAGHPGGDPELLRDVAIDLALSALQRFPGVEVDIPVEAEAATTVTIEPEPVDPDPIGFADNLVQREAAGEWTLEAGLVATLGYFLGEERATTVIPATVLPDESGTAVIRMAQEYLANGDDEETRSDIEAILDRLSPSGVDLPPENGDAEDSASAATPGRGSFVLAVFPAQAPEPLDPAFEEACEDAGGSPLFDAACWHALEVGPGANPEDGGDGQFFIWYPDPDVGPNGGWAEDHAQLVTSVIEGATDLYGVPGLWPEAVQVWLRASDPGPTALALTDGTNSCDVHVFPKMRTFSGDQFNQAVARQLAYCYIESRFPDETIESTSADNWWIEGLAVALSSALYPNADLEQVWLPDQLEVVELGTSVLDRQDTNWVLFESMASSSSVENIQTAVIDQLPISGGRDSQLDALAGIAGFDQLLQRVARELTDGQLPDVGGTGSYEPEVVPVELSEITIVEARMDAFETRRLRVDVPSGSVVCIEQYGSTGELLVEWRQGEEGSPAGGWQVDLPDELTGSSLFVLTTTDPDGISWEFEARLMEGDDCDEDEDDILDEDTLCDIDLCGPSEFYSEE